MVSFHKDEVGPRTFRPGALTSGRRLDLGLGREFYAEDFLVVVDAFSNHATGHDMHEVFSVAG